MGDVTKYGHFFDQTRAYYDNHCESQGVKEGSRENGDSCKTWDITS
jgi:hypothetical protein